MPLRAKSPHHSTFRAVAPSLAVAPALQSAVNLSNPSWLLGQAGTLSPASTLLEREACKGAEWCLDQEDPWRRTLSAQAPAGEIRHALMDQRDQLPAAAGFDVTAMTGEMRLKSLDPGGWMAAQAQSMAVTRS